MYINNLFWKTATALACNPKYCKHTEKQGHFLLQMLIVWGFFIEALQYDTSNTALFCYTLILRKIKVKIDQIFAWSSQLIIFPTNPARQDSKCCFNKLGFVLFWGRTFHNSLWLFNRIFNKTYETQVQKRFFVTSFLRMHLTIVSAELVCRQKPNITSRLLLANW